MARPKKQPKIKEPIRLRTKTLANGNKSLYLDMYQHGKREYLFLRLYLIPETDKAAKVMNQNTLRAANAIKAQKIIELSNGTAGLNSTSVKSKIKLSDWLDRYRDTVKSRRPNSDYFYRLTSLKNHLSHYNANVMLRDVDKEFCEGFINHLLTAPGTFRDEPMKRSTAQSYLMVLNAALNTAVREEMMRSNPLLSIDASDKPHGGQSMREYLTVEEIKTLMETPCQPKDEATKSAFLFSCFCGLRYSDVAALTWGNIEESNGHYTAKVIIKKTERPLYVPLSSEALRWMPERGTAADDDKVFSLPDYQGVRRSLKKWLEGVKINKHITFHVARHTFATLMLTLGADLYTTSKLLGHSKVTTTQIYAKIVDAKKVEAVNLVNNIFGNGKET